MRAIIALVVVLAIAAGAYFFFFAGDGGEAIALEAEGHQETACACETFDCTTEHVAWFNRMELSEEDTLNAMSEEFRGRFDVALNATADCQDALRTAEADAAASDDG